MGKTVLTLSIISFLWKNKCFLEVKKDLSTSYTQIVDKLCKLLFKLCKVDNFVDLFFIIFYI